MSQRNVAVAVLIFVTVIGMRAPITGVGPAAGDIITALEIDYSTYGIAAALPVWCLGTFSLAVPWFLRRMQLSLYLPVVILMLACALALRLVPTFSAYLPATLLIGASIAMLNTLMPAIVRHLYADRVAVAMSAFSAAIGCSSTLGTWASSSVLPTYGWQAALGIWLPMALMAMVGWMICARKVLPEISFQQNFAVGLFVKPVAWTVFLTMSMQSLSLYTVCAWLPQLLRDSGFSVASAGFCTSLFLLSTIPASLFTARFIRIMHGERRLSFVMTLSFAAGICCWAIGGDAIYLGSILAGIPQGTRFTLALMLLAHKADTIDRMLELTAVTQFTGYLIAGIGPIVCGMLYSSETGAIFVYGLLLLSGIVWGISSHIGFGRGIVFN